MSGRKLLTISSLALDRELQVLVTEEGKSTELFDIR